MRRVALASAALAFCLPAQWMADASAAVACLAAGALSPSFACAGGGNLPLSRGCYKAKFSVPGGDGWQRVVLPLSSFSDLWSSATGEHTKECSEDASACLTAKQLGNIQRVELWAEGADGTINLEARGWWRSRLLR